MTSQPARPVIPFHDLIGVEILDAAGGSSLVRAPDTPQLKNHLGTVHGGMLFTLGEIAAAVAISRLLGSDLARLRTITSSGRIDYLKPARGEILALGKVQMSRDDILAGVEAQPSITVPIKVELSQAPDVVVARLEIDWFVARLRA